MSDGGRVGSGGRVVEAADGKIFGDVTGTAAAGAGAEIVGMVI